MKKLIALLLTLTAIFVCCGCFGPSKEELAKDHFFFENKTGVQIDGLHISSKSASTWGEKVNEEPINVGASVNFEQSKLVDGNATYDFGAIDHDGLNYDVYDVTISVGDTITLSKDDDEAVVTVTAMDGTSKEYRGETYKD